MSTADIVCPSGLAGTVRKWKISEGNILASKKVRKQNKLIDELMRKTWLKTEAMGLCEYAINGVGPRWTDVLAGDRMYALIQGRILTWTTEYDFKWQCDNPVCDRPFWWSIDLSELPVKKLSEKDAELFRNGNRFTEYSETLGKQITFQLMTGTTQRQALRLSEDPENQEAALSTSLASRILDVEGVRFDKKRTIREWLDDQDLELMLELVEIFDAHDCGVQTKIEIGCQHCPNEMEIELPFGKTFFMPNKRKKPKVVSTEDSSQTSQQTI